jgi:hypothetical protein
MDSASNEGVPAAAEELNKTIVWKKDLESILSPMISSPNSQPQSSDSSTETQSAAPIHDVRILEKMHGPIPFEPWGQWKRFLDRGKKLEEERRSNGSINQSTEAVPETPVGERPTTSPTPTSETSKPVPKKHPQKSKWGGGNWSQGNQTQNPNFVPRGPFNPNQRGPRPFLGATQPRFTHGPGLLPTPTTMRPVRPSGSYRIDPRYLQLLHQRENFRRHTVASAEASSQLAKRTYNLHHLGNGLSKSEEQTGYISNYRRTGGYTHLKSQLQQRKLQSNGYKKKNSNREHYNQLVYEVADSTVPEGSGRRGQSPTVTLTNWIAVFGVAPSASRRRMM